MSNFRDCHVINEYYMNRNSSDRYHSAVVYLSCDDDYKLEPETPTLTCQDGEWYPRIPKCEPIYPDCPEIRQEHMITNTSERYHSALVGLTCETGYKVTQDTVMCGEGYWLPFLPECEEEGSEGMNDVVIIVICVVATLVALAVLIFALYMLLQNCKKDKKKKNEEELFERKMSKISTLFGVSQDSVGMPPFVYVNMSSDLKGRPYSTTSSESTDQSVDSSDKTQEEPSDKAFYY